MDIKQIAQEVEAEFQMGGLSDGLYFDFAKEVAKRVLEQSIPEEWSTNHTDDLREQGHSRGWNACRQATIDNFNKLIDE